jgi:flagellar hook-length control protein FliK
MTIGVQMPFRSMIDANVRGKGKDDVANHKPAKGEDSLPDFSSMMKVSSKPKFESSDATADKDIVQTPDAAEPDSDKGAILGQGVFGQAILAFEQLLDHQKREGGSRPRPADEHTTLSKNEKAAAPTQIAEPVHVSKKAVAFREEEPGQKATVSPAGHSEAPTAPTKKDDQMKPAPGGQLGMPVVQSSEAPKPRVNVKAAPEPASAPSPDTPAPLASSPPVQAEARLGTTVGETAAPRNIGPGVIDLQVVSERSAAGSIKTLVIQLQPIELGTVTARMRLIPEGLHVQLIAENTAAAEHLARDHDALGRALQRAGVTDDASSVIISVIDRSSASSSTQTGQQHLSGQDQQLGPRAGGQGASHGPSGGRSDDQHAMGKVEADERGERTVRLEVERNPLRGLVV